MSISLMMNKKGNVKLKKGPRIGHSQGDKRNMTNSLELNVIETGTIGMYIFHNLIVHLR